jgi:hypothetical protein
MLPSARASLALALTCDARSNRGIMADPDGGYFDRFFDRTPAQRRNLILNPFYIGATRSI